MIVTCYRVNSGFRNVIDSVVLERPHSDVIYHEVQVVLPVGYELRDSDFYGPQIYDEKGEHCELSVASLRCNTVVAISTTRVKALKNADELENTVPLQDARIDARLTQRQLADASGVNIRQIQYVESGKAKAGNMTAKNLLAIADALGVDPRSII